MIKPRESAESVLAVSLQDEASVGDIGAIQAAVDMTRPMIPGVEIMTRVVRLRVCAIAALLLVSSSSAWAADGSAEANVPEVRIPTVTVATADVTEVIARIAVSGTLVPREEVLVNPEINGYAIEKINVDIGSRVKAGDVLAVLSDRTLAAERIQAEAELLRAKAAVRQAQSEIDSTKAAMDEAEATLERTRQLDRSGNVTRATLNQSEASALSARAAFASAGDGLQVAEAEVVQAQSKLDLAELNFSRAEIKAPVAGVVSARNAKLGAIAASGGDPMFRIIRDGEIEVEAEVIETALGAVEEGDPAEMAITGNGTVPGKVRLIAPTVDQTTRLGIIRISLDHSGSLRTGLFASGWIVTDRHDGTTVPSTAVLNDLDGTFVQVVEDGVVEKRMIAAGLLSEDGRREIIGGLKPGETVMARAGAFFRDGDKVDPIAPNLVSNR